jgi:iron complex outermembrane receptor protein
VRPLHGRPEGSPRIVPIRWGGGLYFASEAFDARVGFLRNEAQDRTTEFESSTASYTWIDASLAYRFEPIDDLELEANVTGRNLNDVRGRNHVAFNKETSSFPAGASASGSARSSRRTAAARRPCRTWGGPSPA